MGKKIKKGKKKAEDMGILEVNYLFPFNEQSMNHLIASICNPFVIQVNKWRNCGFNLFLFDVIK